MKFPIEVNKIEFPKEYIQKSFMGHNCGDLVKIRPCDEKYKNKTYLGIYLGELPISSSYTLDKEKTLDFYLFKNPAIFVPELKEIIFGCGSWWGSIQNEEELKKITDEDIDNVWYVKMLKDICSKKEPENE